MTWELAETGQGGVEERKLLWTNPSPASDFAEQTLDADNGVNLIGYNSVKIKAGAYNGNIYDFDVEIGDNSRLGSFSSGQNSVSYITSRNVVVSSTGILFSNCYLKATTSTSRDDIYNNNLIPQKIYGIRTLFDGQTIYYWKRTA